MEIDLLKYGLSNEVCFTAPDFKIFEGENTFLVFSGVYGKYKFDFREVQKDTELGKLCQQYTTTDRHSPDIRPIATKIMNMVFQFDNCDYESSKMAYLKYWAMLPNDDKLNGGFYDKPYLEVLKEWLVLYMNKLTPEIRNSNKFDSDETLSEQMKVNILGEIKAHLEASQKTISRDNARELCNFYNWIEESSIESCDNKQNPTEPESDNHKQYTSDTSKIIAVYRFCIDDNIIDSSISELDFINDVAQANFAHIYDNAKRKKAGNKCKYIISVLRANFPNEWYANAAHSINTETNKLTGRDYRYGWKQKADALR